jgi:diguanylate cyclase (GGDEF)-like protein
VFWNKKPSSPPQSRDAVTGVVGDAKPKAAANEEFEQALDAFANVVRVIGRFAIDSPEAKAQQVQQLADHWSQHLLIRRPKPGDESRSGTPERDYRALVEFVTVQRKQESSHVVEAMSDLRQTVWAFIRSLSSAFADDAKGDALVTTQLTDLRNAAEHGSLEELRRAAVSVAASISAVLERRRDEQSRRNSQLGEKLVALGRGLEAPRSEQALDALTQLNDRRAFDEYAEQLAELRPFVNQPTSLLLVGLDNYQQLVDSHGAQLGDELLCAFSRCLVRTFLRKDDFLGRFAAEQFVVVFPDTELKHALVLGERLPAAVRRLEFPDRPELSLSVTVGASSLEPADTVASWIERAQRMRAHEKSTRSQRSVPA